MQNSDSTTAQNTATTTATSPERRFQINILPFGIIKKFLVITPQGITYGSKTIETEAITGIHTRIVRSYTNGIRTSTAYTLTLTNSTANFSQVISFSDLFYGSSKGKMFDAIMEGVREHAGTSLLTRLLARIQTGGEVTIGPSVWRKDGVVVTPTKMLVLKGDPVLIPYERLQIGMSDGSITLQDRENKKAHVEFAAGTTGNSYMVDMLYDYLVIKEGWRDAQA